MVASLYSLLENVFSSSSFPSVESSLTLKEEKNLIHNKNHFFDLYASF